MVKVPRHIEELSPYKAGKPISELIREKGLKRVVKLASNENPNGPSPLAMEAVRRALAKSHLYVDPGAFELVRAISEHLGKPRERIVTGHGTDAILEYIVMSFSEPGDEVLTSVGTFIGIYVNTNKLGRSLVQVPLRDYAFDLDAIAERITDQTRIIYLANPNNPTGSMISRTQLEEFMRRVPAEVVVVHDEAYCQYCDDEPDYPNGVDYDYPNFVVTRTFSKAYGLGGLRVGYAYGPPTLISLLAKVKLPFEPNHLAQVAAAAALKDFDFLELTRRANRHSLQRLKAAFDELGIHYLNTYCNSLLLLFQSEKMAEQFFLRCLDEGLIVRHVKSFGIPEGIRINSGNGDDTTFALDVIKRVYPQLLGDFANPSEVETGQQNETCVLPQQK